MVFRKRRFCHFGYRLGVVACSCNPATWRSGLVDGLRAGVLLSGDLCRSGVRTKQGINMVSSGEPRLTRRFCPLGYRLGVVACSCNLATWRSGLVDGLRAGVLLSGDLCRSGVRTKQGINMVSSGEPRLTSSYEFFRI
uniref:Uncharacterized protein n=1 Tax=Magallana gigas TaxID=29159 RepID=A0A8W8JXT6_MAGGI